MDLWVREARIFKYGSGTGSNFSDLRGEGEPLSGGGKSSGLMSFLKIGDRAAGAIKSGGTTRRAAKMVALDLDHPDIEEFVNWKVSRRRRSPPWWPARGCSTGTSTPSSRRPPRATPRATSGSTRGPNPALRRPSASARQAGVPDDYIERVLELARQGFTRAADRGVRHRLELEAYYTVSGQN